MEEKKWNIEKKPYGFKLTFSGSISPEEMQEWADASRRTVTFSGAKHGVVVDMVNLKPLSNESQTIMVGTQSMYKKLGMKLSAVLVPNTIIAMQFRRLAKESGIDAWERYIDVSKVSNPEKVAEDWVMNEIDPGK